MIKFTVQDPVYFMFFLPGIRLGGWLQHRYDRERLHLAVHRPYLSMVDAVILFASCLSSEWRQFDWYRGCHRLLYHFQTSHDKRSPFL